MNQGKNHWLVLTSQKDSHTPWTSSGRNPPLSTKQSCQEKKTLTLASKWDNPFREWEHSGKQTVLLKCVRMSKMVDFQSNQSFRSNFQFPGKAVCPICKSCTEVILYSTSLNPPQPFLYFWDPHLHVHPERSSLWTTFSAGNHSLQCCG